MNNVNECTEKLTAYQAEKRAGMATDYGAGMLQGAACGMDPRRPSLMESVESQLNRATGEAYKADQLRELQYLLQKNPDVARILDLIEVVRR